MSRGAFLNSFYYLLFPIVIYRNIAAVRVSVVGMGCWALGGGYWGIQNHSDSLKALHAALRGGVTHFDTAPVYGRGKSEQVTGQQLKKYRKDIILATKSMYYPKKVLLRKIEVSLKRLCTDYIDIFYIHWPVKGVDIRPMVETLEDLRRKGVIRLIGISNFSVADIKSAMEAGKIDVHQIGYSIFFRFPEKEIIPCCIDNGISIVTYGSLGQGIFTGKFPVSPLFCKDDRRKKIIYFESNVWPHVFNGVKKMKELAAGIGLPLSHLIIQWTARKSWVSSVLVGARNRSQSEENFSAFRNKIDDEIFLKLDRISDDMKLHIPEAENIFRHKT